MNRNIILEKLQSISFCAVPTVATMDMGLEFDYVTPEGGLPGVIYIGAISISDLRTFLTSSDRIRKAA